MSRLSAERRALDAEARAVEEGHRAFVQDDGSVRVVSDRHEGKAYRVTMRALSVGEPIRFTCDPAGSRAFEDDHLHLTGEPGLAPCKHAALAARRLEREGLAAWVGGGWVVTELAAARTAERLRPSQPADPFEGLC